MPPVAKKRPAKKPKLAVKTSEDGQSITFGEQPAIEPEEPARDPEDEENGAENDAEEDVEEEEPAAFDPLAEFRRASSVAAKAVKQEKERYTEIERHLLCVFDEMEEASIAAGPGRVALHDVLEAVSRGTAPLTQRAATQRRPSKAVPLQLPSVFNRDQFMVEMARVQKLMDAETFEANVLGLFACFYDADQLERDAAITQRGLAEAKASEQQAPPVQAAAAVA